MPVLVQIVDWQVAFGRAIAELGDVTAAAKKILAEMEQARVSMDGAADSIREFVLKGDPDADLPYDEEEKRLTPAELARIDALMDTTVASQPNIAPAEMVALIESSLGIQLQGRFGNPNAFIGSKLKRRRPAPAPEPDPVVPGAVAA